METKFDPVKLLSRPPRVLYTGKGVRVCTSTLTDSEALEIMATLPDNFSKGMTINSKKWGLNRNQMPYAHKQAMEAISPKIAGPAPAELGSMAAIVKLFATAKAFPGSKLKRPKIRLNIGLDSLLVDESKEIQLAEATGRSRTPGSIFVTDGGPYGRDRYYGRIDLDGKFYARTEAPVGLAAFLAKFAADPAGIAAKYGSLTGNCGLCEARLSADQSTAVGYGKRCAERWGFVYPTPAEAREKKAALLARASGAELDPEFNDGETFE